MTTLCEANILTINIKHCTGANALENDIAFLICIVNNKFSFVNAHWVHVWNVRHITREWEINICVVWMLIAL